MGGNRAMHGMGGQPPPVFRTGVSISHWWILRIPPARDIVRRALNIPRGDFNLEKQKCRPQIERHGSYHPKVCKLRETPKLRNTRIASFTIWSLAPYPYMVRNRYLDRHLALRSRWSPY